MKNILLSIVLLSSFAYSQVPKLELNATGMEPLVIVDAVSPASTIYAKTINWLEQYYDNPDKLIVSRTENKEINIKSVEPKVWVANRIGIETNYDIEYSLKIEFKDGKYRITYNLGNFEKNGEKLNTTYKDLFVKYNGNIKHGYGLAVSGIEDHFNKKVKSLSNFIAGNTTNKSNNDW